MNDRNILFVEDHPGDEALTSPTIQKSSTDPQIFLKERPVESSRTPFSQWLQREINKRGLTQSALGRAAGLGRAVICKVASGQCQPEPATLQAIAGAFDIPVETIYRAAGLLPALTETETGETIEEAIHLFRKIKDPGRRETAVQLLRVLAGEEAVHDHKVIDQESRDCRPLDQQ